ncbi:hypothetical protein U27_02426 [Candidatus Vecturithrix granuli]|uniref:Uncharacterized protein n=1 Tax=Vecturithrix granuli TaxID=1499967 RepID=A0A0S6W7D5_VECG1|nr:hypothetical protein U27_02426 [Candidatus Vecturithrix granuli]
MNEILKNIAKILEHAKNIPIGLLTLIIVVLLILGYFSLQQGTDTIIEHLPQILEQLVKSPLGIFALMIIVLALIGFFFFQEASEDTRIVVFVLMFFGVFVFGVAMVVSIRDSMTKPSPLATPTPQYAQVIPTVTPVPLFTPTSFPTLMPSPTPMPTAIPTSTPIPLPTPSPTEIPTPTHEIAVFVVEAEHAILNTDISSHIQTIMQKKGKRTIILPSNIFTTSEQFDDMFNGRGGEIERRELSRYSQYIILGKRTLTFVEHPELENAMTATISLAIHLVSSQTGIIHASFTLQEKGVGFSKDSAEKNGMEKMMSAVEGTLDKIIEQL